MELIGKLVSNDTTKVVMLLSDPKYISVKFVYQCLHILNNKGILDGLKGSTKMQRQNNYSNINHVNTMVKVTLVLITEV